MAMKLVKSNDELAYMDEGDTAYNIEVNGIVIGTVNSFRSTDWGRGRGGYRNVPVGNSKKWDASPNYAVWAPDLDDQRLISPRGGHRSRREAVDILYRCYIQNQAKEARA